MDLRVDSRIAAVLAFALLAVAPEPREPAGASTGARPAAVAASGRPAGAATGVRPAFASGISREAGTAGFQQMVTREDVKRMNASSRCLRAIGSTSEAAEGDLITFTFAACNGAT